jgi:hypothetical protein
MQWPSDQQGIFAIDQSLRRQPMQPGQTRTIQAFLPLVDRTVTFQLTAKRAESVEIADRAITLLRIEAIDPRSTQWNMPTVHWSDENGLILKTQEAFLGRETVVADQQTATALNDFVTVDLGVDLGVPIEPPIANSSQVKYAVYRVHVDGLRPSDVFPDGPSQRVLPDNDQVALVTVSEITPDAPPILDSAATPPQPADVAPNALVQSDHPSIRAIADSVAGSVDDPWFAAQLLENHVHRRLKETDYSQIFSSAVEVAKRREGDCSEHAVLLAAVCRARGIPARVAVGLCYSASEQRFLYHMWNEVWIKDRWIPLDATRGEGSIGACHIKLLDSNLSDQTAYDMVSPVIQLIGRTKIEVIAAQMSRP